MIFESDTRVKAIDSAIRGSNFVLKGEKGLEALSAAHVANTRWSILFDLTERRMTLCLAGDTDQRFTYTLD